MSVPVILPIDLNVQGTLSARLFIPPSGSITDASIIGSAGIQASKFVRHQSYDSELFPTGTTVAALTRFLHTVTGTTGTIMRAAVTPVVVPTGDHTITVDVKKSTGAGAFASILTAPLVLSSSSVALTAVALTFSNTALVANDNLEVVITVAGSTSSQGTGLFFSLVAEETYS